MTPEKKTDKRLLVDVTTFIPTFTRHAHTLLSSGLNAGLKGSDITLTITNAVTEQTAFVNLRHIVNAIAKIIRSDMGELVTDKDLTEAVTALVMHSKVGSAMPNKDKRKNLPEAVSALIDMARSKDPQHPIEEDPDIKKTLLTSSDT